MERYAFLLWCMELQLRNEASMRMISSRLDRWNSLLYSICYLSYCIIFYCTEFYFAASKASIQLQCIRDPLLMNIDFLVIFWRKICFLLYIFIKWKQILIVFQNLELKFSWCWQICLFFDWLRPRPINKYLLEVHSEITSTFTLTLKNESG